MIERLAMTGLRVGGRAASWGLVALLGACGGGGGGSDPPPPPAPLVTNVRIAGAEQDVFSGREGLADIVVLADVTGDLSRLTAIYVIVEDPDGLFQPNPALFYRADGRDNQLRISPKPLDGRTGSFAGPLRINVCADPACASPLRGSPVLVPYSFQVLRGLSVSTAGPVVLASDFGQPPPAAASFDVTLPDGATGYEASLVDMTASSAARLTLTTAGNRITLTPELGPVLSKRYMVNITATGRTRSGRTSSFSQAVPVTYDVRSTGTPVIFNPDSLAFTLAAGTSGGWVRFESLLAIDDVIDRVDSISYGTVPWLSFRSVDEGGHRGVIEFLASSCSTTAPPPGVSPCLAPGVYPVRITLRTRGGFLVTRELEATLTVTP